MKTEHLAASLAVVLLNPFTANALTITRQPTNQWVSLGAHVTNQVTASSTAPPITYQWYGKGALLPDQTNRTCILTNIQLDQAGDYYVVVNDADNQPVQSNVATVSVDPTFIKITQGDPVTDLGGSMAATWIDYDEDGWVDLFVGNNTGGGNALNHLYHNNRDGSFTKITTNLIGSVAGAASCVAWGDYDNDGTPDLYVANGGNRLPSVFQNEGGGAFTRVTAGALVNTRLDGTVPLWGDFDNDGFIDLFLSTGYWSGPQTDRLYHNEGDGTFRIMIAAEVGPLASDNANDNAFGWNDYDHDGDLDLFLTHMSPPFDGPATNYIFRNSLSGTFEKIALTDFDVIGQCWGAAWGDFDNDGYTDVFLPSWSNTNALFKNLQGQGFVNVAPAAGLALAMSSEGSAWGDYDSDGWLDLCVGNYLGQPNYPGGQALFHNNRDGTFTRITTGSPSHEGGYTTAVAWGDYDNDGFLDLYIACGDGVPQRNLLYRNNGVGIDNTNHWLKIKLNGQASNRLGIGAKIRVLADIGGQSTWQLRTITGQHSWIGNDGLLAHFGLGDASKADLVRVEWPSGNVQELTDVPAGQAGQASLTITEQVFITPARPSSSLGGAVALTSSRTGATAWQWYHDGVAMDGQTGRTLPLSNISTNDAGRYSVVVEAATGTFTNHVYLFVDTRFEKITTGDVVNDRMMGVQGAWGDYDSDGHLDLAVTGGYWDTSGAVHARLYHNDGAGNLATITDGPLATSRDRNCYLAWADYDNDDDLDLIVGVHEGATATLYVNQGNGQFVQERTTAGWIANAVEVRASTVGWGDYDADGNLDLMLINWAASGGPARPDALLHNLGDGRFDVITNSTLALRGTSEETIAWVDYDGDGDLDFSSAESDSTQMRRLFRNLGHGQFEPVTDSPFWGQSRANGHVWADYDNDGDFDVLVGGVGADLLFQNDGQGNLQPVNLGAIGLVGDFARYPAWGDYDNDGYLDLFSNGSETRNRLFQNRGDGTFEEIRTGNVANDIGDSYMGAWGDFDGDGYLDLFVANDNGKNDFLYRNNHKEYFAQMGKTNHWLRINLRGTASNRSGIGAKVYVTAGIGGKLVRQLRQIGGQTCAPELFAHFGLGNATRATTVRIEWPSGTVQELSNVTTNQILTIWEPPFLRAAVLTDGACQLTVTAEPNRAWRIEASTDLRDWQPLTTETPATATFRYPDTTANTMAARFYRVVAAP